MSKTVTLTHLLLLHKFHIYNTKYFMEVGSCLAKHVSINSIKFLYIFEHHSISILWCSIYFVMYSVNYFLQHKQYGFTISWFPLLFELLKFAGIKVNNVHTAKLIKIKRRLNRILWFKAQKRLRFLCYKFITVI